MTISLGRQIAEVERELKMRKRVYPHMIASGKLQQKHAEFFTTDMQAVLATLRWLQENETTVRAAVSAQIGENHG